MKPNISHTEGTTSDNNNSADKEKMCVKKTKCCGCDVHNFSPDEIHHVRQSLLQWFDVNQRDLPWRRLAVQEKDRNRRGYGIWVSEVMLQQTQVSTVVGYYEKWMKKWPTLQDLSKATLEEVNEIWSGLGYYSRARRLYEGCQKVVTKMHGEMPSDAASLIKHLPGVGRYTAGAIASIAFGECTGVVDGNVVRVLSRLRVIGQDSSSSLAVELFWKLVTQLLDTEQPGNFNQAMMELGATVCTPKTPDCKKCPLNDVCAAYKQSSSSSQTITTFFNKKQTKKEERKSSEVEDIEEIASEKGCQLCFPDDGTWNNELGVCNYPRKQKLKAAREETVAVCVVNYQGKMGAGGGEETLLFICKRPAQGLLAGLWEFPNMVTKEGWSDEKINSELKTFLRDEFNICLGEEQKLTSVGKVQHIFSHIHHTYVVHKVDVGEKPVTLQDSSTTGRSTKWITTQGFLDAAVSTNMKKVFDLYSGNGASNKKRGIKRKKSAKEDNCKQQVLDSFFVRK